MYAPVDVLLLYTQVFSTTVSFSNEKLSQETLVDCIQSYLNNCYNPQYIHID